MMSKIKLATPDKVITFNRNFEGSTYPSIRLIILISQEVIRGGAYYFIVSRPVSIGAHGR